MGAKKKWNVSILENNPSDPVVEQAVAGCVTLTRGIFKLQYQVRPQLSSQPRRWEQGHDPAFPPFPFICLPSTSVRPGVRLLDTGPCANLQ